MATSHKKIAFVTRRSPHGTANAREALDAVLASSAFCEDISLFFIADGVYQITTGQEPKDSLQRHISPTFGMLDLYDIEQIFFCEDSLAERGLQASQLFLGGAIISKKTIADKLGQFDQVIHF